MAASGLAKETSYRSQTFWLRILISRDSNSPYVGLMLVIFYQASATRFIEAIERNDHHPATGTPSWYSSRERTVFTLKIT